MEAGLVGDSEGKAALSFAVISFQKYFKKLRQNHCGKFFFFSEWLSSLKQMLWWPSKYFICLYLA